MEPEYSFNPPQKKHKKRRKKKNRWDKWKINSKID